MLIRAKAGGISLHLNILKLISSSFCNSFCMYVVFHSLYMIFPIASSVYNKFGHVLNYGISSIAIFATLLCKYVVFHSLYLIFPIFSSVYNKFGHVLNLTFVSNF
ncbi:hypothetical protein L9F63_000025, partial [Diploptera punctata]